MVDAYVAIRNASPAYRQMVGQNFLPKTLAEIQAQLAGDDGLVLEYVLGQKAGYLIVIPAKGEQPRVETLVLDEAQAAALGVEAGPLTASVLSRVLSTVDGSGVFQLLPREQTAVKAADKLAVLWSVLIPSGERQKLRGGQIKRLTVIPDGGLSMLPFETLVVEPGSNPTYLLDLEIPIVYAPSSTLLSNLQDRDSVGPAANVQPVLSVADPVYPGEAAQQLASADSGALADLTARSRYRSAGGELERLPFTADESRWVGDVFGEQGVRVDRLTRRGGHRSRRAAAVARAPGAAPGLSRPGRSEIWQLFSAPWP